MAKHKANILPYAKGDDYWTDPHKLQKQVDFLDQHPDFALTHHQLEVIYEDGSESHAFNHLDQKEVSTLDDLYTRMKNGFWAQPVRFFEMFSKMG